MMKEESEIMHRVKGPGFLLWDVRSCPFPTEESQIRGSLGNIRSAAFAHSPLSGFAGIISLMAIGANDPPLLIQDHFRALMFVYTTPKIHVRKMIHELRSWAKRHPAPANYLVISGDNALSSTLKNLHNRNYNILVAHPDGHSTDFAEIASCVWTFSSLLRGEPPNSYCKEMLPRLFTSPRPKVSTLVLWDLRTCSLPTDDEIECRDILDNVYSAVLANSSCTQITMKAVGLDVGTPNCIVTLLNADMSLVFTSPETQLSNMIYWMEAWAMSNPVPANFLVISGDAALSQALKNLQSRNYNILVAHPDVQSADLVANASHVWKFQSLVRGEAPYFVRRVEEPSKLEPAAVVRPKKKKSRYQRPKEGLRELEMNHGCGK